MQIRLGFDSAKRIVEASELKMFVVMCIDAWFQEQELINRYKLTAMQNTMMATNRIN